MKIDIFKGDVDYCGGREMEIRGMSRSILSLEIFHRSVNLIEKIF
jgi:hypothetical protein